MLNVLMVGHACDPRRGSEHASTWNWAWYLSKHARITLLSHEFNRHPVEDYLRDHPNPNLCLEWTSVPRFLDPWRPAKNDSGIHLITSCGRRRLSNARWNFYVGIRSM